MATYSKVLPDSQLQSSQRDVVVIKYVITAAKTARQVALQGVPAIHMFDTGDSSQAAVDSLLGVANDIVYATSFGSTALGAQAFGFVIRHGLAKKAISMRAFMLQTAGGTPVDLLQLVEGNGASTTALPNTLTAGFAVTPAGNLYGRIIGNSNLDSATAGSIVIELEVESA